MNQTPNGLTSLVFHQSCRIKMAGLKTHLGITIALISFHESFVVKIHETA
jgi:hypothetical protein